MTAAKPVPYPRLGQERAVRMFPGTPASVERARAFVAAVLAGCPARDTLVTCVSELCTNAITHTRSSSGVFTVEVVRPAAGIARVAVTDAGGPGEPVLRTRSGGSPELREGGRGLSLVSALTSRWGYRSLPNGCRVVWAEATWPVSVPA